MDLLLHLEKGNHEVCVVGRPENSGHLGGAGNQCGNVVHDLLNLFPLDRRVLSDFDAVDYHNRAWRACEFAIGVDEFTINTHRQRLETITNDAGEDVRRELELEVHVISPPYGSDYD